MSNFSKWIILSADVYQGSILRSQTRPSLCGSVQTRKGLREFKFQTSIHSIFRAVQIGRSAHVTWVFDMNVFSQETRRQSLLQGV